MPLSSSILALGDLTFRRHRRSTSVPSKNKFSREQKFNSTVTFSRSRSLVDFFNGLPTYGSVAEMDKDNPKKTEFGKAHYVVVEPHNTDYDLYTPKLYNTQHEDNSLHGIILGNHDIQYSHTVVDEECPNTHWPVYEATEVQGEKTQAYLFSIDHNKSRRNLVTCTLFKSVRKLYKIFDINKLKRKSSEDDVFEATEEVPRY